ncbi:MAG TPA: methyltransferase domain-containing protein, partial [Planctomycetota bacterium]|nr:methyltransferase domain-containing protein [Planctomycetota bacterium]
ERRRAGEAFVVAGDPASGLRPERLRYEVRADGLIGAREAYDLVTSRAVLEHVSDLAATYVDMARALRPGGMAVHLVDLKSHGLHREHPLDFLTWPAAKWRRMYAGKGFPNRHRLDRHRDLAAAAGLKVERVEVVDRVPADTLAAVRPHLDAEFRHLSDDDLSALGFWLTARKR